MNFDKEFKSVFFQRIQICFFFFFGGGGGGGGGEGGGGGAGQGIRAPSFAPNFY